MRSWLARTLTLGLACACGSGAESTTTATGSASSVGPSTSTADTAAVTTGPPGPTGTGANTGDGASDCSPACDPDEPPWAPCDPWVQDCPRGQKCTAWDSFGDGAWDETRCVPVTGDGQGGDPCTVHGRPASGEDDCALGHVCVTLDPESTTGTCAPLCAGSPDRPVCPPGQYCEVTGDGVLNLCVDVCDPLAPDCPRGQLCAPARDGQAFSCLIDASGGQHPPGTPCEILNQCDPGGYCAHTNSFPHPGCQGSDTCCAPFCDLNAPDCPGEPPGLVCEPFFGPEPNDAPPGLEHVGACIVPP